MQNTNIGDRVYITQTFLLANFGSQHVSFFEVTRWPPPTDRDATRVAISAWICLWTSQLQPTRHGAGGVNFAPLSGSSNRGLPRGHRETKGVAVPSDAATAALTEMTSGQILSAARRYIEQAQEEEGTWSEEGDTPVP